MYLLYSTKQAIHQNISRVIDLESLDFPDVSKQAVSRARQGIKPSLFQELFDITVDMFTQSSVSLKLWRGKERVFAIDGSKIQVPNSSSNFEKFGEMFSKLNPDKHWSMALASVIYDVTNDYICHGLSISVSEELLENVTKQQNRQDSSGISQDENEAAQDPPKPVVKTWILTLHSASGIHEYNCVPKIVEFWHNKCFWHTYVFSRLKTASRN